MSIVITGASGRLGRFIIKELLHHVQPDQIVACVRQMESAASFSMTHLHLATEHAIRTTGIPYTFLRSGLYMDFIEALDLHAAISTGNLRVHPGSWQFNAVTRSDLAAAIAGYYPLRAIRIRLMSSLRQPFGVSTMWSPLFQS